MICTGDSLPCICKFNLFLTSYRMLINIVTSHRVFKYECRRVVKEEKESLSSSESTFTQASSSESTLAQAFSRCIIKCGGFVKEADHAVCLNMFDCYGETTLMHAAVINDPKLVRCDFCRVQLGTPTYTLAEKF